MTVDYTKYNQKTAEASASATSRDVGLRTYMVAVYRYMTFALLLSGFIAFGIAQSEALMQSIYGSPLSIIFMLAPLGVIIYMNFSASKLSVQGTQFVFWLFAALMGVSLASIFSIYTDMSIARVFFISAAMFGSVSIYGYVTKSDLTGLGTFAMMGLIGLIIASVVNLFLQSSQMYFITSVIGVIVFTALTAYDTQKIKDMYFQTSSNLEAQNKVAIFGALNLYLDFINLFLSLLRIMGDRR